MEEAKHSVTIKLRKDEHVTLCLSGHDSFPVNGRRGEAEYYQQRKEGLLRTNGRKRRNEGRKGIGEGMEEEAKDIISDKQSEDYHTPTEGRERKKEREKRRKR